MTTSSPWIWNNTVFRQEENCCILGSCILVTILFLYTSKLFSTNKQVIKISSIDKCLIIYLLYLSLITFLHYDNKYDYEPIFFIEAMTLVGGYILVRQLNSTLLVIVSITVIGFIQSIIGISQQFNIVDSMHSWFKVTGTFHNPGPLGGFLAISFVSCWGFIIKTKNKIARFLAIIALCLIWAALILADSRASWISAAIGISILLSKQNIPWLQIRKKTGLAIVGIAITTLTGWFLFLYRPASVFGRFLVARVSLNMILEKLFFGHGIGSFASQYMLFQEKYFASHPNALFTEVAGNVIYPYNELLRIAVEQGIIGIIFFLATAVFISQHSNDHKGTFQPTIHACLITWLIFSFFSYPISVFPLLLLLIILLASLHSASKESYLKKTTIIRLAVILFSLLGIYHSWNVGNYYHQVDGLLKNAIYKAPLSNSDYKQLNEHNKILKDNLLFSRIYFQYILKYDAYSLPFIQIKYPSSDVYNDLGNYYLENDQLDKSKKYFKSACNMVPTRIRPHYGLFQAYLIQGDTLSAYKIAQKSLEMPLKVENSFTISAKSEMRSFVTQKEYDKK